MRTVIPHIFVLGLIAGCMSVVVHEANIAGVKHFYYEINDKVESQLTRQISNDLEKILPRFDYIISESSAAEGWPFYGQLERGSLVMKSDMMPPHSNVNRLSPIHELDTNSIDPKEHIKKLIITISLSPNGKLIVSKESFRPKNDSWIVFSMKSKSEFDPNVADVASISDKISKTLIRYTFK
ncbi:MAG: hypothetical protein JXR07_08120 [Reichenbachiella sp.]